MMILLLDLEITVILVIIWVIMYCLINGKRLGDMIGVGKSEDIGFSFMFLFYVYLFFWALALPHTQFDDDEEPKSFSLEENVAIVLVFVGLIAFFVLCWRLRKWLFVRKKEPMVKEGDISINPLSFRGRTTLGFYWIYLLIFYMFWGSAGWSRIIEILNPLEIFDFDGLSYSFLNVFIMAIIWIFCVAVTLFWCWTLLAFGAKRCHDLGKSGWWQLVPFFFILMMFKDGVEYDYD